MATPTEVLLALTLTFLFFFIWHWKKRSRHPPGPLGLPIFGMMPFRILELWFSSHSEELSDLERFQRDKERYGSIWSVEFGGQRIVTLCSWEMIHKAFFGNAELFSGRPDVYRSLGREKGIIFLDGEVWRRNRRLAIKSLKDLGMGKKDLENEICDEGDALISYLEVTKNTDIDLMEKLIRGVSNIIIRLVFHERHDYSDCIFEKYVENLRLQAHSDSAVKKFSLWPALFQTSIMQTLCPDVKKYLQSQEFCRDFVRKKCLAKSKHQVENMEPDCVYDHFHRYRYNSFSLESTNERQEQIVETMCDLFNAGIDSSSNLLSFCFLMVGRQEELQIDLRNEVRALTEDYREIKLDMKKNCPKLLSFIDEVQRFCCLVPKVPHRVLQKCVFHGYELYPTDIILADFGTICSDPDVFENPKEFNAFRFTDETRTKYCPSKYLIPFGIGKRSCLGESIAQMELFIFLTKIIHKFKISLTEETMNNFENIIKGQSGFIHAPLDHSMILELI